MTATKELTQVTENCGFGPQEKFSGVGHQLKKDEKAYHAAAKSLRQAVMDLIDVDNSVSCAIRIDILKLVDKCQDLSYSANEKFNQND